MINDVYEVLQQAMGSSLVVDIFKFYKEVSRIINGKD